MKSGINLALLLGVLSAGTGAVLKTMHASGSNAFLILGLFVMAIAFVFRMLQNAPRQHE